MRNSVVIQEQGEYKILLVEGYFVVFKQAKGFIQQVSKQYLDKGWAIRKFNQLIDKIVSK